MATLPKDRLWLLVAEGETQSPSTDKSIAVVSVFGCFLGSSKYFLSTEEK